MLPLNPSKIPEIYQAAMRLQEAGDIAGAFQKYKAILAVRPKQPEVRFQVGRIALAQRRFAEAVGHFEAAVDGKPDVAAFWDAYAQAVVAAKDAGALGRLQARVAAADLPAEVRNGVARRVALAGKSTETTTRGAPIQEVNLAVSMIQSGDFGKAKAIAETLDARHPDVPVLQAIIANAEAQLGHPGAAEARYRRAIELDKDYAEARSQYAQFLLSQDRRDEAIVQAQAALAIAPRLADPMLVVAEASLAELQFGRAITMLRQAAEERPDDPRIAPMLIDALCRNGQYLDALPLIEAALAKAPDNATLTVRLAQALAAAQRQDDAMATFDRAMTLDPDSAFARTATAEYLQSLGRFDAAGVLIREGIDRDPGEPSYYQVLAAGRKMTADDPAIALMQALWADRPDADAGRVYLGFALAKAMEDTGAHDRVFTYLRPANDLARQLYPFDLDHRRRVVDEVKSAFGGYDYLGTEVPGRSEFAPIFVTGMPRSGTTLVEQIVASHSQVAGAGEVGSARSEWNAALSLGARGLRGLDELGADEIADVGHRIEARLRELHPDAARVTDKGIQNYMVLGAIRLALPNARVVVVRRDPRDNLFSIYKNPFAPGRHAYAYDMTQLAAVYGMFAELVAFWRDLCPGWIHEIQYEDLVRDPEPQTRRLIEACGLPWEDACLDFHKTERQVSTLSLHQVRQPIYTSSTQAWQRHEDELQEMLAALDALDAGAVGGAA
ncbi:MAG: sulfotransferase [Rhodobacter sp.]|nr:sulfotransferase [Rhodobacter sp.]